MTENKLINVLVYLHFLAVKIDHQGVFHFDFKKIGFIFYNFIAVSLYALYGYFRYTDLIRTKIFFQIR